MIIRSGLVLLGLFHFVNGLWMLVAPDNWYAAVPGVSMSGPINHHFIADIGLIFLASGAGFVWSARNTRHAAVLALAGATWPALHALLHVWGWLHHGFPSDTQVAVSEGIGVVFVGALGVALAWLRFREREKV